MAPRRVTTTINLDNINLDYSSSSSVDPTGRPLPFTSAHNRLIESTNSLPRGALNRAYRQAFGTQVNSVIRNLVEPQRPFATSGRDFRCGYRDKRASRYFQKKASPPKRPTTSAKKPTTSAERLAQINNSSIRRSPRNALKAQQQARRPALPVQRGGIPSSAARRLRPRPRVVSLAERFQLAAAASQRAARYPSAVGQNPPECRHATVEEVSDVDEVEPKNVPSSTFGASSTRPGVPAELLRRPGGSTKQTTETGSVAPSKYKTSKFTEDLNSILPSRPVSVQKSPLFGNIPPSRPETITTKRRNWVGGLFGSNKAPAAATTAPIVPSTSNGGGGGLFGSTPATPAPISPPGTGVFGKRLSTTSADSNFGAEDGLGGLDEETIEAIRLARRAAAARGERSGLSPMSRGRYGLSCLTPSSSSKKNQQQSSRPLPSPEFAPRYAGYNNNRKPTFGGHAEIHGVNRSNLTRSNALRDPYRTTGAQGVAGVSGVHRVPRVETRRAGTGRPRYFAPNPDRRPQNRGGRQVPGTGQWLAGGYGRGRW